MSRFLRAGLIRDRIDDIVEASLMLLRDAGKKDERIRDLALDIVEMARELREFISRWECEPLIYTGKGSTDEIISLLDSLLQRSERAAHRARRSV
jgi:hypothetical protein